MRSIIAYIGISVLIHISLFLVLFQPPASEISSEDYTNDIIIEPNARQPEPTPKNIAKTLNIQKSENTSMATPKAGPPQADNSLSKEEMTNILRQTNPHPEYPRISRVRGEQGRVMIRLRINNSDILAAQIQQSSGYKNLDQAALDSVKKWNMTPEISAQLKSDVLDIPFLFKLHD